MLPSLTTESKEQSRVYEHKHAITARHMHKIHLCLRMQAMSRPAGVLCRQHARCYHPCRTPTNLCLCVQAMSRPAFSAISMHATAGRPALLFVPTRKLARLVALDLLTFAASHSDQHRFRYTFVCACVMWHVRNEVLMRTFTQRPRRCRNGGFRMSHTVCDIRHVWQRGPDHACAPVCPRSEVHTHTHIHSAAWRIA